MDSVSASEFYDEGFYHGSNDATPITSNEHYMEGWRAGQQTRLEKTAKEF